MGHRRAQSGFTLIELLIAVGIVGLLSGILVPNLIAARERAQYARVVLEMRNMAAQIVSCLADGRDYPADVSPGVAPSGCPDLQWPADVPFNSTYDYENWDLGGGRRWIGLTFYGKARNRAGIPANTDLGDGLRRVDTGSNITYSLAIERH